jgi:hypothetical protein
MNINGIASSKGTNYPDGIILTSRLHVLNPVRVCFRTFNFYNQYEPYLQYVRVLYTLWYNIYM